MQKLTYDTVRKALIRDHNNIAACLNEIRWDIQNYRDFKHLSDIIYEPRQRNMINSESYQQRHDHDKNYQNNNWLLDYIPTL